MNFFRRSSAFRGYAQRYTARVTPGYSDPLVLLNDVRELIFNILFNNNLSLRLRFIICLTITFMKRTDESLIYQDFYFCSCAERITSAFHINEKLDKCFQKILNSIESFIRYGSGWVIKAINSVDVHVGKYSSNFGGCYKIKLPKFLKNKKCLLNIKCNDNLCFIYCVLAQLYP